MKGGREGGREGGRGEGRERREGGRQRKREREGAKENMEGNLHIDQTVAAHLKVVHIFLCTLVDLLSEEGDWVSDEQMSNMLCQ